MRRILTLGISASVILLLLASLSWGPLAAETELGDAGNSQECKSKECKTDLQKCETKADASQETQASEESDTIDPLSVNAACYVCHIPFVREKISKVHLKHEVTCVNCHGVSAGHANDEDIGATKPDVIYKREQVNAACRKCHEEHDAPPEKVVTRWLSKPRSDPSPVCTDCHGEHKLLRPEEDEPAEDTKKEEEKGDPK